MNKKRSHIPLILSLVSCACGLQLCVPNTLSQEIVQTKKDDLFLNKGEDNYDPVMNLVLQDKCGSNHQSGAIRWVVCVRIIPGFPEDLEYTISLEKLYNGTIRAYATRPRVKSIHLQLLELSGKHPAASVKELSGLITTESISLDQEEFPQLKQCADKFERLRLSPVPNDAIWNDATKYAFRIESITSDSIDYAMIGPGADAKHQPSELLSWAESMKRIIAVGWSRSR